MSDSSGSRKRKSRFEYNPFEPSSKKIKLNDTQTNEVTLDEDYNNFMASLGLPTIPPTHTKKEEQAEKEDSIDPLDAFMINLEKSEKNKKKKVKKNKSIRLDLETKDTMEQLMEQINEGKTQFMPKVYDDGSSNSVNRIAKLYKSLNNNKNTSDNTKDLNVKYDSHGNLITIKKNDFESKLKALDHSKIYYGKFKKNIYKIHSDIKNLNNKKILQIRKENNINIIIPKNNSNNNNNNLTLNNIPSPVLSFGHLNLNEKLVKSLVNNNYTKLTSIQMQSIPLILSGFNVLGISVTGSGKSLCFILTMIEHIINQSSIFDYDENIINGPIACIIEPTRELASQVYNETAKFLKYFDYKAAPLYGGVNQHKQELLLKQGIEIIISTPGRLIELLIAKKVNLLNCTFLVIDECDIMFNMGFYKQLSLINQQIRPNKQLLLFSATVNKKIINNLINNNILINNNYIQVKIGNTSDSNETNIKIQQIVEIFTTENDKFLWLLNNINNLLLLSNKVLIFCGSKIKCTNLNSKLANNNILSSFIHGDILQYERLNIINEFKKLNSKCNILIATDVLSRGINIPNLNVVINFDAPININNYIHKIGRVGRENTTNNNNKNNGSAYTLLTPQNDRDKKISSKLINFLKRHNQEVNNKLIEFATKYGNYKQNRNNKFFDPKMKVGSHIIGHSHKHEKLRKDAMHSYSLHGFESGNVHAMKRSFANSFVSQGTFLGEENNNKNNNNNKSNFQNNKNNPKKQRKSRWGRR